MRAATVAVESRETAFMTGGKYPGAPPASSGPLLGLVGLDREPGRDPAAVAARERAHVAVPHALEVLARQHAAVAAAAVAHDRGRAVGEVLLDVALDHALAEVERAGQAPGLPLVLLAHIDQHRALAARAGGVVLGDAELADVLARLLDQGEEAGRVDVDRHRSPPVQAAGAYSRTTW